MAIVIENAFDSATVSWSETFGRRIARQRADVQRRTAECRARLDRFAECLARHVEPSQLAPARDENQGLAELEQLEHELEARRTRLHDDSAEVARQKARYQSRSDELEREWDTLSAERARTKLQRDRLAQECREQRASRGNSHDLEALRGKVRQVSAERDQFQEQLQTVQQQLQAAVEQINEPAPVVDSHELATVRGKYELAMTDLKELRRRNTDLEHARSRAPGAIDTGAMDWESQKRRLLAVFEAEELDGPITGVRTQDRLSIEGTIVITDQIIQERDNEIAELKRRLNEPSHDVGQLAIDTAAIGRLLDTDAIIAQQRQHLKELEGELQQKLRTAEIEISRERATLARDRAEIDERRRDVDSLQLKTDREASSPRKSSSGGNWLARLGLKGDEP